MKSNRLQYRISHISGEEPGHSASELLNLNSVVGYQSPRFAVFPLELIVQFNQGVQVDSIQIMAHQFKIAQSIDVHLGSEEGFLELGTIEFDNNMRHNFSVKELKTVQISKQCQYLKLLINRNHTNKLNIFNQVGIMMLQVYGTPVHEDSFLRNIKKTRVGKGILDAKLAELLSQKELAIQNEDY